MSVIKHKHQIQPSILYFVMLGLEPPNFCLFSATRISVILSVVELERD